MYIARIALLGTFHLDSLRSARYGRSEVAEHVRLRRSGWHGRDECVFTVELAGDEDER